MEKNRKWWGLAALMPAIAMIFVDQSVLPVALPTIQKQLGATNVELQWSINSYLLVTAILVLAGGKVSDWLGHRKAFSLGIMLFALASALCGLSPDVFWLIMARAFQGVGAALMFPASTAILMSLFPPSQRGKALGINISAGSLFLILGPLIGGYFTETYSWRWIFWINLPLAILGLFMTFLFLPRSISGKHQFDRWGFLFFVLSCSFLVCILMQGREWGWTSSKIMTLFIAFSISTVFLLRREKKAKHPFLDLSLFRHPIYRAVNISVFSTQFIMMITVFRAIFFQDSLGWSPMKSGVITVISSLPVLFMSPIGGMFSDKFGPKFPIAAGFLLLIFSFVWTPLFIQSSLGFLFLGLIAFGLGIPMILTPSYASAMGAIPPTKAGSAFGTIATIRSLSATLGVAAMGSFIDIMQLNVLQTQVGKDPRTKTVDPSLLDNLVAGTQNIQEYLKNLSAEKAQLVLSYLKKAQFESFFYIHLGIAVLLLIAFVFVFVLYHRKSGHHLPEMPAEGWD